METQARARGKLMRSLHRVEGVIACSKRQELWRQHFSSTHFCSGAGGTHPRPLCARREVRAPRAGARREWLMPATRSAGPAALGPLEATPSRFRRAASAVYQALSDAVSPGVQTPPPATAPPATASVGEEIGARVVARPHDAVQSQMDERQCISAAQRARTRHDA